MRKIILIVCFAILLLSGCTLKKESNQIIENTISPEEPVDKYTDLNILPQKIQDIIYSDGNFFDVESQQNYTKESLEIKDYDNIWKTKWGEYIVFDFDDDGEQELVVRLENKNGDCVSTKIFDKQEDMVYAYSFVYRAFLHVYKDGTIDSSSGADAFEYYKLKFNKNKKEETIIAESTSEKTDSGQYMTVRYVEGKKVTEEELYSYINEKYARNTEILWSPAALDSKLLQEKISKLPVQKKDKIVYNVDVTGDGIEDTITVDISNIKSIWKKRAVISVKNSEGDKIWSDKMELSDTSGKLYYLCNMNGRYCLIRYITDYMKGDGRYSFEAFYLGKEGEKVIDSQKVQFQTYPLGKYEVNFSVHDMSYFAYDSNEYFFNGILLLEMKDGEVSYSTERAPVTYQEEYKDIISDDIWKKDLYLGGRLAIMRDKIFEESKNYEN